MPRFSITIPIRTCGSRRGRKHLWRRQAPQRSGPETASAHRMLQLIARRILETIPVLVLVATITFFMMKAVPGGPLDTEKNIPQEIKLQIEAFYGLDQPLWKQYASYMGNLLRGDLGPSFKHANRSVNELIAAALPVSLELGGIALCVALLVGIPLGIAAAVRQNTWIDYLASTTAMAGICLPTFVMGPLLVLVFSLHFEQFNASGWDFARDRVLPALTIGLVYAGYIARLTRGGMLEVLNQDFIRTARAKGASETRVVFRHARRGGLLPVVTALSLFGPLFLAYSYEEQNLGLGATPPSAAHLLGTDKLGRDQLARLFFGGRVSLLVGLAATSVSLTIGVLWGSIAGYAGGKLDAVMMRIVDILYALPFTIFVILLMTVFGRNFILLFVAIGAVEWLTMARIVRGQVLALKRQEFIEAAVALGLRKRRIVLRHVVPNVLGPVMVYTTLTIPAVMLLEAFLSFLGLGVQPPMSSWGLLIKEGAEQMEEAPWLLIYPAAVFAATLFSLNFLGDGLRDALDVRASKD